MCHLNAVVTQNLLKSMYNTLRIRIVLFPSKSRSPSAIYSIGVDWGWGGTPPQSASMLCLKKKIHVKFQYFYVWWPPKSKFLATPMIFSHPRYYHLRPKLYRVIVCPYDPSCMCSTKCHSRNINDKPIQRFLFCEGYKIYPPCETVPSSKMSAEKIESVWTSMSSHSHSVLI